MARVWLVHADAREGKAAAARLSDAGHDVTFRPMSQTTLRTLLRSRAEAFVIDLSRVPSMGRDVAMAIRATARVRKVPIVFVGGAAAKVAGVRRQLPDASFAAWSRAASTLERALAHPPAAPAAAASVLAGYSGTPLPRKLGIKEGAVVGLIGAPKDFARTLGDLPPGVTLKASPRGARDLTLWFVTTARALETRMATVARQGGHALWICWPKKASGVATDVSEALVRKTGLDAGLVDYKICAVDATWSGLKFARRKSGSR